MKNDIENAALKFGIKTHAMHSATKAPELEKGGLSYQKTKPNQKTPFGHYHTEQEEIYVVIKGSGRMKLNDDIIDLKEWDAVRVSQDATRQIEAGNDGIEFLVFGAPRNEQDKGEIMNDWWK